MSDRLSVQILRTPYGVTTTALAVESRAAVDRMSREMSVRHSKVVAAHLDHRGASVLGVQTGVRTVKDDVDGFLGEWWSVVVYDPGDPS